MLAKVLNKHLTLHKKWSFQLRISSINVSKSARTADLVTFTEEILIGKLQFLCSVEWISIQFASNENSLIESSMNVLGTLLYKVFNGCFGHFNIHNLFEKIGSLYKHIYS